MAKRVLDKIMTEISSKKSKNIGKKTIRTPAIEEETRGESERPIRSKPKSQANLITPKEATTGRSKGRTKRLLLGDFLAGSEAESDSAVLWLTTAHCLNLKKAARL